MFIALIVWLVVFSILYVIIMSNEDRSFRNWAKFQVWWGPLLVIWTVMVSYLELRNYIDRRKKKS